MSQFAEDQSGKTGRNIARYDHSRYLLFTLVHEQIAYRTKGNPAVRRSFSWSLTRPGSGKQTFTRKCEYCDQLLSIDVVGIASTNGTAGSSQKLRTSAKWVGFFLILALLASFFLPGSSWLPALRTMGFILLLACAIILFSFSGTVAPGDPGYRELGELWKGREHGKGPINGHYVEKVANSSQPDSYARAKIMLSELKLSDRENSLREAKTWSIGDYGGVGIISLDKAAERIVGGIQTPPSYRLVQKEDRISVESIAGGNTTSKYTILRIGKDEFLNHTYFDTGGN